VVARVRANLRRATQPDHGPEASDFAIDLLRHRARFDGQDLQLTRVELRILSALTDPPGRVWSRDQLLDRMYDDQRVVSDRTVDSHITNLRRKLQGVRPDSECIHSVYGVGYKLEL
jgi:two-component system response regulator BaeR